MGAPEPDHARLLDEFFGPEQPSRHPAGPGKLAGPRVSMPACCGMGALLDSWLRFGALIASHLSNAPLRANAANGVTGYDQATLLGSGP